jgi:hypothetical protein
MRRTIAFVVALFLAAIAVPAALAAQQMTRSDSAGVLYQAALRMAGERQRDAADAVLRFIVLHYGDTPAGAEARRRLIGRPPEAEGGGRVELVAWSTLYGAWLGIAVPIAMSADRPEIYGIGLVVGGPLGFVVGQRVATSQHVTLGEARAMTFGFRWGSSQAPVWLDALSGGDVSVPATWTSIALGGVGGMALGGVVARRAHLSAGRVAFAAQGYYWGLYYTGTLCAIFDLDCGASAVMGGGDALMIAAALAAPAGITAGRAWLVSAMGIAAALGGLGIDLIVQPDDGDVALAIPMATSALGLLFGSRLAENMAQRGADAGGKVGGAALPSALLDASGSRLHLGLPVPTPTLVPVGEQGPRRLYRPALTVPLLHATF